MSATSLFGEHLRREREMRGVSLEEISAATRISVRFLEALENEQWERLPGGIFNRGFIRSIAKFLGLDEDGLIAEYALETHERPEIAVWTKEPVKPRTNWFVVVSVSALVAALISGGWYVHRAYGERISAWHERHPIISTVMAKLRHKQAPAGENSETQVSATTAQSSANAAPASQANAGTQPTASALQTAPGAKPNAGSGTEASTAAASGQAAIAPGAAAAAAATSPTNATAANGTGALVLKVEAGETSVITVAADGKIVFSGKLDALKTLTLRAQKSFTVSASKSNAVLLELNGRTVPPLGPPNEPGKITLTRDNLKTDPGDAY